MRLSSRIAVSEWGYLGPLTGISILGYKLAVDTENIIQRLRDDPNRKQVARDTGLPYSSLCKLVYGITKNPGSSTIDTLRHYYQRGDRAQ